MGGPLDIITPDEFTIGQGSSEYAWAGGHLGSDPAYSYDGETESTYAALTWDIPSFEGESDGISRETQRNLSLLIDQLVEEEVEASDPPGMVLRDGAAPPAWLPGALAGSLLVVLLIGWIYSRRQSRW